MSKYYKCNKCGSSLAMNHDSAICTVAASYRSSGICAGSISQEIDKKEYLHIKSRWRAVRRSQKIKKIIC